MGSEKVLENFSRGSLKVLEKSWIFSSERVGTLCVRSLMIPHKADAGSAVGPVSHLVAHKMSYSYSIKLFYHLFSDIHSWIKHGKILMEFCDHQIHTSCSWASVKQDSVDISPKSCKNLICWFLLRVSFIVYGIFCKLICVRWTDGTCLFTLLFCCESMSVHTTRDLTWALCHQARYVVLVGLAQVLLAWRHRDVQTLMLIMLNVLM